MHLNKIIAFIYFISLGLFPGFFSPFSLSAMTVSEESQARFLPKKIQFDPSWSEEDTQKELHFFWTTGVCFKDCTETGKKTPVDIGGIKYSQKFKIYLTEFLENPLLPLVRFMTDELTLHTNPWLQDLQTTHPQKFFIALIQDVENRTKTKFPEFEKTISVLFENAQRGNPAIASDAYRLIGMIFHNRSDLTPFPLHLIYCDIDTFVYGIEKDVESLFKALFRSSSGRLRGKNGNDIISIQYDDPNSFYEKNCRGFLEKWSEPDFLKFFSYFPERYKKIISLSGKNIDTLKSEDSYDTTDIVTHTGPHFLERHFPGGNSLTYPSCCAASWQPVCFLSDNSTVYLPQSKTDDLKPLFQSYYQPLEYLTTAKKLGVDHPAYLLLQQYVQATNPFFSEAYKTNLQNYFDIYSQKETSEEGKFEKFCKNYVDKLNDEESKAFYKETGVNWIVSAFMPNTYLKLQHFLLEKFNIKFELTKADLISFLK